MKPDRPLPLLISVPHGGVSMPPEAQGLCRLDLEAILADGDTWSGYLYDLQAHVLEFAEFPVARAIVDVNRAPGDLPPHNPDGVVKAATVEQKPVWSDANILTSEFVDTLLSNYYYPYHARLAEAAKNKEVVLGLDCHTMLNLAPANSTNWGEQRPLICLGNRGNKRGEPDEDEPLTAPTELVCDLQKCLEYTFADLHRDKSIPMVTLNQPFRGGFITQKFGLESPFPWIQVEINRLLYLPRQLPRTARPDGKTLARLTAIRRRFKEAVSMVVGE